MKLTRRQLIQWSGVLGLASAAAAGVNVASWWDTIPDAPYINLNELEGQVVNAVSGAAFPAGDVIDLDGETANLDRFFDEVLSSMSSENCTLLKFLLETIERSTLPTHMTHFSDLPIKDRQDCIESWLQNPNHLIRGAIQSLIVLLGMGYTAHPTASTKLSRYFRCGFGA